jgi:hypothetical protein
LLELMATGRASRWRRNRWRPQFGNQPQNLGEQHPWHSDLGHLEGKIAPAADLDQLLLQAGQRIVLDQLGAPLAILSMSPYGTFRRFAAPHQFDSN